MVDLTQILLSLMNLQAANLLRNIHNKEWFEHMNKISNIQIKISVSNDINIKSFNDQKTRLKWIHHEL